MAAIAIADCTVTTQQVGGMKFAKIVTPATADDGDTIDCSTIFSEWCIATCVGATDTTLLATAAVAESTTITLPGATDDEARTCFAQGV